MHRPIAFSLTLAVLALVPAALTAQSPTNPDSSSAWAHALRGTWSCAGAFVSGKPLAADITFSPILRGQWLEYHHLDRPPGQYEATGLWGPALHDSSLGATTLHDNFGGHRRFLAAVSQPGAVTLTRDTTEAGARLERFTFRPRPDGTLWFAWEVQRGGVWALGDSLSCRRG